MPPKKEYAIQNAINAALKNGHISFHTPGHGGTLNNRDITELGVNGDIFPADCIQKAETDCAQIYGVKKLFFSVNGSSQAIKAALMPFKGKKVVYAPGVHRAFTEGCELFGVNALPAYGASESGRVYTYTEEELNEPLSLKKAREALDKNPDCAALFITSPDYLGRTADIGICALCKEKNVALIVDSAHGAHFAFAPGLNEYRFDNVADLCNMSAHKTLGAYTQTALLAVNNEKFLNKVSRALRLLGTTSPNYPLLERLEISVKEARNNLSGYLRLKEFNKSLSQRVELLQNVDYTRVCVKSKNARELYKRLINKGIFPEAVIGEFVVFILTPYNSPENLQILYKVLVKNA